jgi:hypothetical protein
MDPNLLNELPTWGKIAGVIGVPAFVLVLILVGLHSIAMKLGHRLLDAVVSFFDRLIARLDSFGIRLEGLGKTLEMLQARLHESNAAHEERFESIEQKLEEKNSR